jgi:tetratricopeptide (TPR) repeat protein
MHKLIKLLVGLLSGVLISLPSSGQNFYEEGYKQYMSGNDDKRSVELFTKAIANNQEVAKSFMMRGASKIYLKDFVGAAADLEYSIKLDSSNHKAYFYYGKFYFAQGFFNAAIKNYNIAISKNSKDADVFDYRAIAKGELGDLNGAIADEDIAIQLNSSKSDFYINRGHSKLGLKQFSEAIEDFNKALSIDNNPKAISNRGVAYAGLGKHEEAIKDFTSAIEKMPKAKDMNYLRGLSYKALGKMDEACMDFSISARLGYQLAVEEQKVSCLNKR